MRVSLWTRNNPQFQSTPSVRRATLDAAYKWCDTDISIHALREEGDFLCTFNINCQ